MKIKCLFCDKEYSKMGINTHVIRTHGDGFKTDPNASLKNGTRKIWNKGLTKETDERVLKLSNTLSLNMIESGSSLGRKHSEESKEKIRNGALKRIRDGKHHGWINRKDKSFSEKFWKQILINNNIFENCQQEHLVIAPTKNYFLDFYFDKLKIDLEIDGSQHERKAIKSKDGERDLYLNKIGIYVYRIKWKSINSEGGRKYIEEEINKFMIFYNKQAALA